MGTFSKLFNVVFCKYRVKKVRFVLFLSMLGPSLTQCSWTKCAIVRDML